MPVFSYECSSCKTSFSKLLPKVEAEQRCKCGGVGKRKLKTVPGLSVYEHIDNGVMARALDRPADAAKIFRERSEQHKREFMKDIDEDDLDPIDDTGQQVDPS